MGFFDKKKDKNKKSEKEHEPTNAEISMKALQGIGAYEEDEETVEPERDPVKTTKTTHANTKRA
jgi:hypothetical protein